MIEMLRPLHHSEYPAVTVYGVDDSPVDDSEITAWRDGDGADDTPAWGNDVLHVQIDRNPDTVTTGLVIHLNDGQPIYTGNPEQHSDAATVLREVRAELDYSKYDYEAGPLIDKIMSIIQQSGVIL